MDDMACSSSSLDGPNSETRKRGLDSGEGNGPEEIHKVYVVNSLAFDSWRQPAKESAEVRDYWVPTECQDQTQKRCETEHSSQRVKQTGENQICTCQDLEDKSNEARSKRLERTQAHEHQHRLEESESDRDRRLARMREYGRQRCQNESEERRAERLAKMRAREHQRRLEESEDHRAKRLAKMRAYQHQRRQSKQTRQSANMLECEQKCEEDVSHTNNSVQLPIPKMDDTEDQQNVLESNGLPCELRNGQDVTHYEKKDQLDGAQNGRAKRLARMRAYEKQRRQEETEEDRAIRLAKMRARERQHRLEETEEERAKRLARMRARRKVKQLLICDQEQEWNASHANSSVQVLPVRENENQLEESEGNTSEQLAVNEHQHQQRDRTEQQSQDDRTHQVPIPRIIKQDNQDVLEGDAAEKILTCEQACGHDVLYADSLEQSRTVKEEDQQGGLEGDYRAICYYSYCDI